MNQYNDFELLYLIKENCDIALDIMFQKYIPLINSRIKSFNIKKRNRDDFFQEGLICLHKAISTYREDKNKTFTRYFDLILQRRFIQILKKESKNFYDVELIGDGELLSEPSKVYDYSLNDDFENIKLSRFEKEVLNYLELGMKAREIASVLECTPKQIYDATDRIKKKIKGAKNSLDNRV